MSFTVVILSAQASNVISCVRSVLACEPELPPEHILVVDDGARAAAEVHLPKIRWVPGIKPFNYARNANFGIAAARGDVILLNDDAELATCRGFSRLAVASRERPGIGVLSAAIQGQVGNPEQLADGRTGLRLDTHTLAFVCVYLSRSVYERIGPLDERFSGYGFEDTDYCMRIVTEGLQLGVYGGCVVEHEGKRPSTFRMRPDFFSLYQHNSRLYYSKWGSAAQTRLPPPMPLILQAPTTPNPRPPVEPQEEGVSHDLAVEVVSGHQPASVDLLYLAWNRLEFTRETFTALLANTDWHHVHELFVYDDGSTDGTREWLEEHVARVPAAVRFVRTNFGSPVDAMVDFIRSAGAPILAKTDNDAMLPPGWLRQSLDVLDRHPELTLLGIEALYPHVDDPALPRSYTSADFVSGLGLYRRSAFARGLPVSFQKYYGLEEWQMAQGPSLVRGWITPAIPVFLLDRLPYDPWQTYSATYMERSWQRDGGKYDPTCTLWHWHWPEFRPAQPPHGGDPRFLCAMRVRNEANHLAEVLYRALALCARAFVFDDHSTDDTAAICRQFGKRVTLFPSPFEGIDEARDKNYLLQQVVDVDSEWVLWIDGDEVLEASAPDRIRQAVDNAGGISVFSLQIAYVWNDPDHVRVDGIFGRFTRPSLFRVRGQARERLQFLATGQGANFHCGNVPQGVSGFSSTLNVRLKHLGYMTREQRQAKYHFYTTHDPNNVLEDGYRHLAEIPGARHAPGPPQIVPWRE